MFDLIPGAAGLDPLSNPEADIAGLAKALLAEARDSRHRRLLVLAGEESWCQQSAQAIVILPELDHVTWVSSEKSPDMDVITARSARGVLGQERDAVVFNAHEGFDPDAFGAVSGIIRGGGMLLLLCPPLDTWEHYPDPASERIAISPFTYRDISGRFIRRLVTVLRSTTDVYLVEQGCPLPNVQSGIAVASNAPRKNEHLDDVFATPDQKAAVEAIEHVVHGHRRRPAVLVSDRGRGKTSALGIASARLIKDAQSRSDHSKGFMHIVVTAPQRTSIDALFAHARQWLPGAELTDNGLRWNESQIQYIAPDDLCNGQVLADLVLVDEAAAIPGSMLGRLLEKYSRIVFATTVHGYEGTGRGFAIRFRQALDKKTPGWKEVLLTQPIRWADNDPLEALVFRALLLDAESAPDEVVKGAGRKNVVIESLDRDALAEDEQTLSQLFGLLVSAHYQTTPNDLRNLLDGPGVSVYVMRTGSREHVVATALVSAEGEFSDELADAINSGQRRPRGHLIPQSLVAHLGIRQAAPLRCARVMRVAVHPAMQGKGLGSQLVEFVKSDVEQNGFDLLGTSFGATAELLKFWKAQHMLPVRIGFRRDHASGEHSIMMLMSLTKEDNNQGSEVVMLAREKFTKDLPHWLSDSLTDLDTELVMALLRDCEYPIEITRHDRQMLEGFANGARSYEDCSAELWRFTLVVLSGSASLQQEQEKQETESRALVAKILQKHSWENLASMCGVSGRSEVIALLRSAVSFLIKKIETE